MKKNGAVLLLVGLLSLPLFAAKSGVPDSAEVRAEIIDSWFTAPLADVRTKKSEVRKDGMGNAVQISAEEQGGELVIAVLPEKNGEEGVFQKGSAGSWLLYRNAKSGKPVKIRWYFNADAGVYVEFRDGSPKTYADMVIYGSYAARSIPMGFRFQKLYGYSFEEVKLLTKNSLPWRKVSVETDQYGPMLKMLERIRSCLPRIAYVPDACYNEDGKLYSIEYNAPYTSVRDGRNVSAAVERGDIVVSSAGFAKWVADGLIFKPKATVPSEMLSPTVNYSSLGKNGVLTQDTRLSFTLDWCRNLAVEVLNNHSTKRQFHYTIGYEDMTGVDVRVAPFVANIVDGAIRQSAGYSIDTGYSPRELEGLLYVLAVTEPRYLYFAALKQHSADRPGEAAFNNCAVFFPYFDETGHFECAVFESGKELTVEEFLKNHKNVFIHLERVRSSDYFNPRQK